MFIANEEYLLVGYILFQHIQGFFHFFLSFDIIVIQDSVRKEKSNAIRSQDKMFILFIHNLTLHSH